MCFHVDNNVCTCVYGCGLCRVKQVAVWTDGAMSQQPWGHGGGNPGLSTCSWFVPELLRWANEDALPQAAIADVV